MRAQLNFCNVHILLFKNDFQKHTMVTHFWVDDLRNIKNTPQRNGGSFLTKTSSSPDLSCVAHSVIQHYLTFVAIK